MTKKRYFNIIPSGIQDIKTGKIIRGSKIGDLLNEQEERIRELETKNKQLNQFINELTIFLAVLRPIPLNIPLLKYKTKLSSSLGSFNS